MTRLPTFDRVARHKAMLDAVLPYDSLDAIPESTRAQLAGLRRDEPTVVVLYYGGTIGMVQDDDGHLVPTDNAARLLQPLKIKGLDERVQVVWFPVYDHAIDSTNGRWVHWVTIGNAIRFLYDMADGFVVCGGTDTMAHMMAAMAYMFPNIGKPIIGAGAQKPMVELGDDATMNLFFAISAAAADLSGVHLAFFDKLMDGRFIRKVQDRRFDAFACPPSRLTGHFDGEVHTYPSAPRRNPLVTGQYLQFKKGFREGVKVVHISPGTPSESILHDASDPTCSMLLLITFGAGNARDEGIVEGEHHHIRCLRELRRDGFPVVLGSPMMDGRVDSPYRAGARAVSTDLDAPDEKYGGGAISAGDTTGPSLEVKCMIALDRAWDEATGRPDHDRFRQVMETNLVGELTAHRR